MHSNNTPAHHHGPGKIRLRILTTIPSNSMHALRASKAKFYICYPATIRKALDNLYTNPVDNFTKLN